MKKTAKGNSVSKKLSNLAIKTGAEFRHLATAFFIERLVARLTADKTLSKSLVFKGGFVGLRVYNSSRYTIDLDALLRKSDIESTLKLTKEAAESDLDDGVWFRFESQIDLETQGEYGGIRQVYRVGFGEVTAKVARAQILNFDLGIGDPVEPVSLKMNSLIFGEEISWSVYPVETIIAEKLHALIDRGHLNSRSKDIFDLVTFLPQSDHKLLGASLEKCFSYRNTDLPSSLADSLRTLDTGLLKRGWKSALASVQNAPDFEATFQQLISLLEAYDRN